MEFHAVEFHSVEFHGFVSGFLDTAEYGPGDKSGVEPGAEDGPGAEPGAEDRPGAKTGAKTGLITRIEARNWAKL